MRRNPDLESLIVIALLGAALAIGVYLVANSGNSDHGHHPSDDRPSKPHFDTQGGRD